MSEPGLPGRLAAILRQRCPSCRKGRIFRGPIAMNLYCPVCELRLHREPGYTTVAIDISYLISLPLLALAIGLVRIVSGWPLEWAFVIGALLYLPLSPAIFRYARTIWIHLDQQLDPPEVQVPEVFAEAFRDR